MCSGYGKLGGGAFGYREKGHFLVLKNLSEIQARGLKLGVLDF